MCALCINCSISLIIFLPYFFTGACLGAAGYKGLYERAHVEKVTVR